ncbi:hypothetical protein Mgra_00008635 [Meloidogyne graminicola]|uniref:Uncharacterized protein n=1 Tax=Meloidogyne graminicola TaxID=189291 RepID=A0A8S9ZF69_9BILA|nr:hypothetical protein Mgra_00008635 [Meloidogyne graminicola]
MTSEDTAWVTLATNDGYAVGALVLAYSLRNVATLHKLHVLYTSGVNVLDSGDETNLDLIGRPDLGITFTKLHCWKLIMYSKCVLLKIAMNCFERPEFSAAPDIGWPDLFNTGI